MTARLFKYSLPLFFVFSAGIYSQVIQSISISGNKVFSLTDLQNTVISFKSQKVYPGIADSARLSMQKYLASGGYYNPVIKAELTRQDNSKNYTLNILVDEGPVTYLRNIIISDAGASDFADAAIRFSYLKSSQFILADFEKVIAGLLTAYENSGYPFAVIKIVSVSFTTDSTGTHNADIRLSIDKKNLCKIERIEVEGNSKTDAGLIIRTSRINPNSIYSQKKIEEAASLLNRLRFFETVETPSFYYNNKNEGVLKIIIKEKQTNSFDGIIGYVPSTNGNESGYFTGFINIGLRNLFGTGRSASFKWQTETKTTQELELKYSEPWLFNYPFNLDLSLFQRKQDTTYVQRNLEAKLEYLATENISAGVIASTQSTIPSENLTNSSVYNSTSLITGFTLKYDSRDDFYSPTGGIYFSNVYKLINKKIKADKNYSSALEGSFELQKFEIDLALYHSFFEKQVTALSFHARELKGSNYDISDYYQLGGTNTLRGYREKQFWGNRLIWSNFEYRFLFSERSFGFVFLDGGYFLRSADAVRNIEELSDFKMGYGVGMNLDTGLGVLTISFAIAKGESFKEGKIHFGLLNEF
jgi:outer membrane protein insertion porin family